MIDRNQQYWTSEEAARFKAARRVEDFFIVADEIRHGWLLGLTVHAPLGPEVVYISESAGDGPDRQATLFRLEEAVGLAAWLGFPTNRLTSSKLPAA